ncbi:MFS transporter [Actinophytocola sp. NPDC049390]|uniref:MFS transporter n=1 Tax=Actinophytocola sp. NPDC049390 TaxID=3363894 RepID=UPI0037A67C73
MNDGPPRTRSVRGLAGVLGADLVSLTANRLLLVAVPWFVLSSTGSVAQTGLVAFCQITPFVLAQALAGPVIDRIGPRRIAIAGDVVSMGVMVVVGLLHAVGGLHLWALMALMAVAGAAEGPARSAKSVFIPAVTRAAGAPIERGTGLSTAIERTATVAGPAAGGFVVAALGNAEALWLAAGLFGFAALIVTVALTDDLTPERPKTTEVGGYADQLRAGATFLRADGLLRAITGMVVVTNLLDQAFITVLLPVWARESGHGAETVGLVVSVFAATSILAALVAATIGGRLPRRTVYMVGFVIGGVPRFVAMAMGLPLWAVLAVFAVGGLGSGFINPIVGAVTYERIPDRLLGRVRTLSNALAWAGIPFGGPVAALLLTTSGLTGSLLIAGGLYLAAIVLPGMRPEWSQMRRTASPVDEPAPIQHEEKGIEHVRSA